jgi:hypothetical protein
MSHFNRSSGWLIILADASALAQNTASQSPLETCTADDCSIYTTALSVLYGKQKIESVILIDQTSTGFPPGMAAMTQFGGKAQPLLKGFPKEAKNDFELATRPMQRSTLIN